MKKINSKKLRIIWCSIITSGLLIPTVAVSAIACSPEIKPIDKNKIILNTKPVNGTLFLNQDKIVKYSYYSDNQKTTAGQVINKLNVATSTLAGISAGAAVAAAISYGIAWITFGASIPWAVGATVLSAVTGALSAVTGIASLAIQREANQTPSGWSVAITTISGAYSLTSVIKTLVATATSVSVAVGTFSWVFPPVIAAVAVVVFILSVEAKVDSPNAQLAYQWYENNSNSTTNGKAIPGATQSTYTIPKSYTQKREQNISTPS